jgi:ketosteroid isomerase-like protein
MKLSINVATIAVTLAFLSACAPEANEDPAVEAMRAAAEAESRMSAVIDTGIMAWDTGNTDLLDAIMSPDMQRRAPDMDADSLDFRSRTAIDKQCLRCNS